MKRDDDFWKRVAAATELRRELGEQEMARALDELQRAQNGLARACAALSPILGAAPDWRAVSALHDRVKAAWHRVNKKRSFLRDRRSGPKVDDMNLAYEIEQREAAK